MAVLQKCFCDIPLHRIADKMKCSVRATDGGADLSEERYYSHTDLYGEYAIAFTKSWGEINGIQPVQYLNEKSAFCSELGRSIISAIALDDGICDEVTDNYLNILSYLKPLRGEMVRYNKGRTERIAKNFHDEHEWRFVPQFENTQENQQEFESLIANPNLLTDSMSSTLKIMSDSISKESNKKYWLSFEYSDIKYIIVPNSHARIELINFIKELSVEEIEKYILISKLMVLEDIRRDL